jgi:hypothetical protein
MKNKKGGYFSMKKKVVLFAMVLTIMLMTVACAAKDCKAKDCSEEIFRDGLCEVHYFEKALEDGLKNLDGLFD